MGRHRSDPRGLARILIAALAVAAALALLIGGGVALVNAVTGEPEKTGPSSASSPSIEDTPSADISKTQATVVPLVIRVTGQATNVLVQVAGTRGKILTKGVLGSGETRQYEVAPLQVVAANGGALQVVIYGQVQPAKPEGRRATWFVNARD
ncbi:hypothetical protein BZB76_1005 [Actinomadura pelletieri DSM 43383]|uniref:DUF4115 domain-containing protein n=1 Tax=Actinomadura pelletieri DSM 43383 TaxID=1120940 RepID=A0A495QZZ6_9ACTN|nr:hypothetical protein BZB76_1005 [Actinomadura pelletieri DSM 43383]